MNGAQRYGATTNDRTNVLINNVVTNHVLHKACAGMGDAWNFICFLRRSSATASREPACGGPPPYLGGLRAVQGHHGEERFLNAMANHGGPIYASYTNRF